MGAILREAQRRITATQEAQSTTKSEIPRDPQIMTALTLFNQGS
jgi:hypothetical protein